MRKITGSNATAIGHFNMLGYALSGSIGMLFSKHQEKSTESIKFPAWLSFLEIF